MSDEAAAEAFGVLADPTRIAILRAFAEALDRTEPDSEGPMMPTLTFSEVSDRVDVDSTSRLSYHLEKLDGTYLRQTDEGWTFTITGTTIVRFVLAGGYAGTVEFEPIDVEGRCLYCDAEAVRAVVDDHLLYRTCTECGRRMGSVDVTPAQVRGRDPQSLLSSAKTRMQSHFRQFRENVCTECGGAVDLEFDDLSDDDGHVESIAIGRCRQCWRSINGPPSMWLASHPASVAFHWDRGVDVRTFGLREVTERLANDDWRTDRVGPDEYVVTYRVDDAELRLTIDDALSVLGVERVRRDSVVDS